MHIHVIKSQELHTVCSYDSLTYIVLSLQFQAIHIQVHVATKTSRLTKQVYTTAQEIVRSEQILQAPC